MTRSQTLMVRSASSRVSNHEATAEAATVRTNLEMLLASSEVPLTLKEPVLWPWQAEIFP